MLDYDWIGFVLVCFGSDSIKVTVKTCIWLCHNYTIIGSRHACFEDSGTAPSNSSGSRSKKMPGRPINGDAAPGPQRMRKARADGDTSLSDSSACSTSLMLSVMAAAVTSASSSSLSARAEPYQSAQLNVNKYRTSNSHILEIFATHAGIGVKSGPNVSTFPANYIKRYVDLYTFTYELWLKHNSGVLSANTCHNAKKVQVLLSVHM